MAIAVTAIDRRLTSCPLVEEVGGRREHLRGALVRARHLSLMPETRALRYRIDFVRTFAAATIAAREASSSTMRGRTRRIAAIASSRLA